MPPSSVGSQDRGPRLDEITLPKVEPAALSRTPCIRIPDLLPADLAGLVRQEVLDGLVYERVTLGDVTRQSRAVRPLGDVYFGPMQRRDGWQTPVAVERLLDWFDSPAFVAWLSEIAGEVLISLRPVTAYRLDRDDRICLHDDMSDPSHAVSVAYNLSRPWHSGFGGSTVFGAVTDVTPLPTPADSPIELNQWSIATPQYFPPIFNSLLIMKLGAEFAHGVEPVTADVPRVSLVGIYGRAPAWS